MICVFCGRRVSIGVTCGNSLCQEASYHVNAAHTSRKGSKERREHLERVKEIQSTIDQQREREDQCPACKGEGLLVEQHYSLKHSQVCPRCQGTGKGK